MPSTLRRIAAAAAVLSVGAFAAGCGGGASGADSRQDLNLQPIAAAGPDPFTQSTADSTATPTPAAPPTPRSPAPGVQSARIVSGAAPGLYGGTQSVASCDVEKQIRFLGGDRAKNRAFADAAGIDPGSVASFLRGLTPVVLRGDTRVTNHGFRNGSATSFQSVLQAGTAVLVDDHGAPRVRCACGNPLKPPNAHQGEWNDKGKPWPGYHADRVIVVRPTTVVINNLIIVNITNNTWIERKTGDDGRRDRERPDIQIDPDKPPVTLPPSPPASPSTSPPVSSPPPSPDCPTPTPTVTVTETPSPAAPGSAPPASPPGAATPSGCPTATTTVTATPSPSPSASTPSPGPSTPSPVEPSTPESSPSGDMPSLPTDMPTDLPNGDSGVVPPSPESENV
ncbi:DUF6777 domain-containing protein [Streptomyces xanthochromogenes]|uniref:DUF6777 domain-containing protein n=1 Tax=Streptomyces xanthochromogenes TaxID=67384 RepID=UPI0034157D70